MGQGGRASERVSRVGKTGAGRALGMGAEPVLPMLGLPGVKTHNLPWGGSGESVLHLSVPPLDLPVSPLELLVAFGAVEEAARL